MFAIIKSEDKSSKDFVNFKRIKTVQFAQSEVEILYVKWYHRESKQWLFVANLQKFFKVTEDKKVELDSFALEFLYDIPVYVDFSDLLNDIFKAFLLIFGEFSYLDLYSERNIEVTEDKLYEAIDYLAAVLKEAKIGDKEVLHNISNTEDSAEVYKKIDSFSTYFKVYLLSAYISRLIDAKKASAEKVEGVFVKAREFLDQVKDRNIYSYLLFKFILYYKSLTASYLSHLSAKFIGREYLMFLFKLDPSLEVSQLLKLDFFVRAISNSFELLCESIDEFLVELEKERDTFLFYPEIQAIHTYATTGNGRIAIEKYLESLPKSSELIKLREHYRVIEPFFSKRSIQSFKNDYIMGAYSKGLNVLEKLIYFFKIFYLQDKDYKINIYVAVSIITTLALSITVPYVRYITTLQDKSIISMWSNIMQLDFIIKLLIIGVIGGFFWLFAIYSITVYILRLVSKIKIKLLKIFLVVVIMLYFTLPLSIGWLAKLANGAIDSGQVLGVGKEFVYIDYVKIRFDSIKSVKLDYDSKEEDYLILYFKDNRDATLKSTGFDYSTRIKSKKENYCAFTSGLLKELEARAIKVEPFSPEVRKVLSENCEVHENLRLKIDNNQE